MIGEYAAADSRAGPAHVMFVQIVHESWKPSHLEEAGAACIFAAHAPHVKLHGLGFISGVLQAAPEAGSSTPCHHVAHELLPQPRPTGTYAGTAQVRKLLPAGREALLDPITKLSAFPAVRTSLGLVT